MYGMRWGCIRVLFGFGRSCGRRSRRGRGRRGRSRRRTGSRRSRGGCRNRSPVAVIARGSGGSGAACIECGHGAYCCRHAQLAPRPDYRGSVDSHGARRGHTGRSTLPPCQRPSTKARVQRREQHNYGSDVESSVGPSWKVSHDVVRYGVGRGVGNGVGRGVGYGAGRVAGCGGGRGVGCGAGRGVRRAVGRATVQHVLAAGQGRHRKRVRLVVAVRRLLWRVLCQEPAHCKRCIEFGGLEALHDVAACVSKLHQVADGVDLVAGAGMRAHRGPLRLERRGMRRPLRR